MKRSLSIAVVLAALPGFWCGAVASADEMSAPVTDPADAQALSAPISEACNRFNAALDVAAVNYEDFAYATAGTGDLVDYRDPDVERSNVLGRTALREAAAAAMNASRAPGLPGEVSAPMRSWSLHATKLLFIMGLHGGGDSLNAAATELNADATDAQMACARSVSNS